ncbi:MAG: SPOR domain-containing protein [Gammaproteobacteria bacterium]|nr:SPOR domain-containing protein [Gammaproteobacteria bacterium]
MTPGPASRATAFSYVFWVLLAANVGLGAVLLLAAPDTTSPAAPGSGAGGRDCSVSRPFANLREAMSHAARLETAGAHVEVREAVARGRPDHVVYIEPAASRDAARRVLRELEGQSIGGQVVPAGPLENAVTLGVFAEPETAEVLAVRVSAFGYSVRHTALEREHAAYVVLSRTGSNRAPARPAPCGVPPGTVDVGAAVAG